MSKMQRYIDDHYTAKGLAVIFTNDYAKDPPVVNCLTERELLALEKCHQDGKEMKKTFQPLDLCV